MSIDESAVLKKKRGSLKRQLTTFEHLLESITINTDLESLDLETRFKEKLLPILKEFEKIQDTLESLVKENDEDEEKKNEDERAHFENRYYLICGRVKSLIKKGLHRPISVLSNISFPSDNLSSVAPASNSPLNNPEENSDSNIISQNNDQTRNETSNPSHRFQKVKYPDLKIPTFSGSFDTWLSFFDSFNSMIHNDPDLPTIQKFHYLKSCLAGNAANILSSLATTTENYKVAWDLLKNRYDNKKFIIDSHVKALFDMQCISKEFSIRALYDKTQKHIRALRALSVEVDKGDAVTIHLIKGKLNNYLVEKWEESTCNVEIPTLQNLLDFLERRSQIEETRAAINLTQTQSSLNSRSGAHPRQNYRSHQSFTGATIAHSLESTSSQQRSHPARVSCYICKGGHGVFACSQFLNLSPKERYEAARKVSLCTNCLRGNHHVQNCISGGCRKCGQRHNSLIHFDNPVSNNHSNSNFSNKQSHSNPSTSTQISNYQLLIPSQVVLATAVVDAVDNQGISHPCRIMLDGGSQPHVITERFANKLGLKKISVDVPLGAIDNLSTTIKHVTNAKIKSRYINSECDLSLFVVQTIGTTMPSIPIDRSSFSTPQDLFLADPNFQTPAEVDIILGAQYFYHFMGSGKIPIEGHPAVFQETDFGWVVAGTFNHKHTKKSKISCNNMNFSELPLLWDLNSASVAPLRSREEEACEKHYVEKTYRDESGRYTVQLPFNDKVSQLGASRNTAFKRFHSLESKFQKDPALKNQYVQCMQTYLKEGHMTPLPKEELADSGFFLPHHAVVKTSSITTKTRVVFDGSCKSSTGISLNDTLLIGPTIQDDLFSTFTRFRKFQFALTADIEQMYRQVQLHKSHRRYHKILWRNDANEPIQIYTLNTVTFGTASAPFLAIRTLHQLAEDERESHPIASEILKRDFYVDDLVSGANTLQEALDLRDDLINLLRKGGFNLRKWSSNDSRLTSNFQNEKGSHMSLNPSETVKTLGLFWNPSSDSINYTVNFTDFNNKITKRAIFSQAARLFDPIGLLGPVIVKAKLIIQSLWKNQLGWDDPIPPHLHDAWINYKEQLPLLNHIKFKRCISIQNPVTVQLHGFSDASEKAYGACIYLRSTDNEGKHHVCLICSKSRVAPLKHTSIPKLELCAANLLADLYQSIFSSLKMHIDKSFFWSDSTITIHWINTPSHKLTTFEANRVAQIQSHTNQHDWRHIPTHENPADLISRRQTAHEFINSDIWQQGPPWLSQNEETWPSLKIHTGEVPGFKKNPNIVSLKLTIPDPHFLNKFSSFRLLTHVIGYCLRFIHNVRNKNKIVGPLSQAEIEKSEFTIYRTIQLSVFSKEIHDLSNHKDLDTKSSLLSLNPFLKNGILRVGGRLEHAKIPENQKHPIILPRSHYITKLIIRTEHVKLMHAGPQATLYSIRENYWPIDGRNITRHIIRECVTCFKVKPRGVEYLMGNLPEHRIQSNRPFLNVGVDYCGPFSIKEKRHRNRNKVKAYVSVFVCFATKAVHLELVGDLTTESFLGSLKRFFSRRGKSQTIYSDNATNFLGARNELKELYNFIESQQKSSKVKNYLSKERVTWRFIPPRSPHMGGLWEAAVKSFKHHFTRTIGNTLLTHEQLETYVIEIEAILNSRPLTPLSSDPNDLLPLTPGHFLIGSPLTSFPQTDLRDIQIGRLSSWQHAQQMRQHFWTRWQKEYLNHMISRSKWQTNKDQSIIQVGTLIVLKEDNLPPMNWKLGRIVEVHPGQDNIVRIVTVRTSTGTYTRNVNRLCPLPIVESNN